MANGVSREPVEPATKGGPPRLCINPPLLNSANPWATTAEDLTELYNSTSTGAVTTRTSLVDGFDHDPAKHQYAFFDPGKPANRGDIAHNSSVNSLGYSPLPLDSYLAMIKEVAKSASARRSKGFVISVTGTPEDIIKCYTSITKAQEEVDLPLAMEINLSCPNIPGKPPPAYSTSALLEYLMALALVIGPGSDLPCRLPFGIKTPPYTHSTEFQGLVDALLRTAGHSSDGVCPLSFITATNTLGSCLVLEPRDPPVAAQGSTKHPSVESAWADAFTSSLPGSGLGGMAGAALHPLALGNVATLRRMLDAHQSELGHIQIVGVGGVLDGDGYKRMRAAGAGFVGVGTGLGLKGVKVFKEIEEHLSSVWEPPSSSLHVAK